MNETPVDTGVHVSDQRQGQILAKQESYSGGAGDVAPPMDGKARMAMTGSRNVHGLLDLPPAAGVVRRYLDLLDTYYIEAQLAPDLEELMHFDKGAHPPPRHALHIVRSDPEAWGKATSGKAWRISAPLHPWGEGHRRAAAGAVGVTAAEPPSWGAGLCGPEMQRGAPLQLS
jgi:hypothetical protein